MPLKEETCALHVQHVTVNYDKRPALWDISAAVPNGLLIGILGPNGAGKSTFIKAALGLIPTLSGQIDFFGQPLKKVKQRIAYVPQRESVDWDFPITVLDLVIMGRYGKLGLFRWPGKKERELAFTYLQMVGMEGFADRQISQLSGGQQQRVFLARALIQEPDIFFMDEPFTGVDAATEAVLVQILKDLKEKGKTAFIVHHDLNNVAQYFDWAMLLNMRLVACGPVEEVFTAENIQRAYGNSSTLLTEALTLSQLKTSGR